MENLESKYQLVLKEIEEPVEENNDRIVEVLQDDLKLSTDEAKNTLKNLPATVKTADSELPLLPFQRSLDAAGGKVLIVRPSSKSLFGSSSMSSKSSFSTESKFQSTSLLSKDSSPYQDMLEKKDSFAKSEPSSSCTSTTSSSVPPEPKPDDTQGIVFEYEKTTTASLSVTKSKSDSNLEDGIAEVEESLPMPEDDKEEALVFKPEPAKPKEEPTAKTAEEIPPKEKEEEVQTTTPRYSKMFRDAKKLSKILSTKKDKGDKYSSHKKWGSSRKSIKELLSSKGKRSKKYNSTTSKSSVKETSSSKSSSTVTPATQSPKKPHSSQPKLQDEGKPAKLFEFEEPAKPVKKKASPPASSQRKPPYGEPVKQSPPASPKPAPKPKAAPSEHEQKKIDAMMRMLEQQKLHSGRTDHMGKWLSRMIAFILVCVFVFISGWIYLLVSFEPEVNLEGRPIERRARTSQKIFSERLSKMTEEASLPENLLSQNPALQKRTEHFNRLREAAQKRAAQATKTKHTVKKVSSVPVRKRSPKKTVPSEPIPRGADVYIGGNQDSGVTTQSKFALDLRRLRKAWVILKADKPDPVSFPGDPWIKEVRFRSMHFGQDRGESFNFQASGLADVEIAHKTKLIRVEARSSIKGRYDHLKNEIQATVTAKYRYPLFPKANGARIKYRNGDYSFFIKSEVNAKPEIDPDNN